MILDHIEGFSLILAFFVALVTVIFKMLDIRSSREKTNDYKRQFMETVSQLTSDNISARLAAAIVLRRFLDAGTKDSAYFRHESLNAMSALLRILPSGVFQKTLGDGLAYAHDLTLLDLQKTNLQDVYLGVKVSAVTEARERRYNVVMDDADLFLADLSHSLIERVRGNRTTFYNAILSNARIKGCDFSYADFRGTNLCGVLFIDTVLYMAKFSGASNIPPELEEKLVDGVFMDREPFTMPYPAPLPKIFFSVPSSLDCNDSILIKEYERILKEHKLEVFPYERGEYSNFGQLGKVRQYVDQSAGMIVFGFRQVNVLDAMFRPGLKDADKWSDRWLPTPWNDIEVGMAVMKGIPILLVKDDEINTGVFDSKLSECFVGTVSSRLECREVESDTTFIKWLNQCS